MGCAFFQKDERKTVQWVYLQFDLFFSSALIFIVLLTAHLLVE